MFRGTVLAFIGGWIIWFWLDKNPASLGPLPHPVDGDYLRNFQVTIDLLKQTRIKAAFVYVWKSHYFVLSLATGLAIGMVSAAISRRFARKKWLKLYFPDRKSTQKSEQNTPDVRN